MAAESPDVFLCHNRADKDWVRELGARLEAETIDGTPHGRRIRVFFDEWDIEKGENVVARLGQELATGAFVAAVISPEFFASEWTRFEWTDVVARDPTNSGGRAASRLFSRWRPEAGAARAVQCASALRFPLRSSLRVGVPRSTPPNTRSAIAAWASIAWNLMTGLYYKAGNIPWEVEGLPFDTCFLGISFFKTGLDANAATHTSLAQVFSGHGEGLVMKGGKAVKEPKMAPYMDRQTAERLVSDALKLYALHHPGAEARRLVVHKTSPFLSDEVAGIEAAVPGSIKIDLVSLTSGSDIRFLRSGTHPPLRGTYVKLSDQETLLYTVGYVPEFRQYPGAKNPEPILLRHVRGDSTRETVCEEIISLTKLNWNSCAYASKQPITTLFAEAVGSIMGEYLAIPEPDRGILQTKYRFFM